MTLLYNKIIHVDPSKPVILDTSYLLSNEAPFTISGRMFVPEGVIDELYKISHDIEKREQIREIAQKRFSELTEKIRKGEIFLFRSFEKKKNKKNKKERDTGGEKKEGLSQVDNKVITCAEQFPQGAQILSCDNALCMEARTRGIATHSIATLPQIPHRIA